MIAWLRRLFGAENVARAALQRELQARGVPVSIVSQPVVQRLAAHCTEVANNMVDVDRMMRVDPPLGFWVHLNNHVSYVAGVIDSICQGEVYAHDLQEKNPALFEAIALGLGDRLQDR